MASDQPVIIKKVKKGLQKLEQAVADVTKMQCDIEESESSLQEAQADASNILRQIADQQSITERQKKVCKESSQNSEAVSPTLRKSNGALLTGLSWLVMLEQLRLFSSF